ncbi:hypothetical protein SFB1_231G2, partial [Candidatus Arthromitus sp. SFB-1]
SLLYINEHNIVGNKHNAKDSIRGLFIIFYSFFLPPNSENHNITSSNIEVLIS